VHAFDLHHSHTELTVVGRSLVETAERTPNLDDTVAWDAIDAPGLNDRFYEYLGDTAMTQPDDAIRAVAAQLRSRDSPATALSDLSTWLREHVEYQPGSTSVSTTAVEVLRVGRGVCQDYVHLGLAVLRAAGIPARYASGYLYPEVGGAVGDTHRGDSHAWLEAWVGDWHPVDPTSGAAVAERHVLVARGRDYSDVAPLKGVYNGGPSRSLEVSVDLTRVA
jgi:transglutaminase-like putative cysteine protease